ncbi:MAG: hypothetical protein IT445_06915 [Phycisphaeraceae bacterium]|nr:hypothetical protein [Phycisphaeraceae bacterium]
MQTLSQFQRENKPKSPRTRPAGSWIAAGVRLLRDALAAGNLREAERLIDWADRHAADWGTR